METAFKKNAARLAVLNVGIVILSIASFASPTHLDLANAQQNKLLTGGEEPPTNSQAPEELLIYPTGHPCRFGFELATGTQRPSELCWYPLGQGNNICP